MSPSGVLYVVEGENNIIRAIDTVRGSIRTMAGANPKRHVYATRLKTHHSPHPLRLRTYSQKSCPTTARRHSCHSQSMHVQIFALVSTGKPLCHNTRSTEFDPIIRKRRDNVLLPPMDKLLRLR